MAPAYVANMAPPFVRYWKGWNRPISRRWLGSHKTVVGFGAGVLGAVLVTWLQARLDWDRAIVDFTPGHIVLYESIQTDLARFH